MILLRSLIYFFLMSISIVVYALPLVLVGWMVPFKTRSQIINTWGLLNLKLQSWICGLNYVIKGLDNIPDKNCIVFSKHQSAWETIALRGLLPAEQVWVLKRELMWIPFFGWAMALLHPIAINRKSGRRAIKQIIDQGTEQLNKGHWVIIFPEGTRVAPGEIKRYGAGGALLAEHSGYPILPIAHNAGVLWRRRDIKKYPGTIQVVIGPLIQTQGLSASEINQKTQDWIEEMVASLPQSNH